MKIVIALISFYSLSILVMDVKELDELRLVLSKSLPSRPNKNLAKVGEGFHSVVYLASPINIYASYSDSSSNNNSFSSSNNPSQLATPSAKRITLKNSSPDFVSNASSPISSRAFGYFSPLSPQKLSPPSMRAVRKHRKSDQNSRSFEYEANLQIEIRRSLRKNGHKDLARYIPLVDKKTVTPNSIKMEKFDGEALWDVMGAESLDFSLPNFISKLVELVDAIHELGFAHEDLSVKNIMINPSKIDENGIPEFKLIDFGLSGALGQKRIESDFADHRCAPELIHSGLIDIKVDIYSLGQIIFELLSCSWSSPLSDNQKFEWLMLVHLLQKEDPIQRIALKDALKYINSIKTGPKTSARHQELK